MEQSSGRRRPSKPRWQASAFFRIFSVRPAPARNSSSSSGPSRGPVISTIPLINEPPLKYEIRLSVIGDQSKEPSNFYWLT